MKNFMLFTLTLSMALFLVACGDSGTEGNGKESNQEVVTLKFAVTQPEGHTLVEEVYKPFMEEITEETDGMVEFDFYPAEQLGAVTEMYDVIKDGVADIGFYISTYSPEMMPITSEVLSMPGGYSLSYEGSKAYHKLSKESPWLETDFLDNGVRPIFSYASPSSEVWTRGEEVKMPADLKGLQVRTGGKASNAFTSKLGGIPVNISINEMYEGFDKKVFEVLEMNPQTITDHGLDELVGHVTKGVNYGGNGTGLIINEDVFQDLPEGAQEVIIELGDKYTESYAKGIDESVKEFYQEFEDEGIEISELTEDEKEIWEKEYDVFRSEWLEEIEHPEVEESLEKFIKEVEKEK